MAAYTKVASANHTVQASWNPVAPVGGPGAGDDITLGGFENYINATTGDVAVRNVVSTAATDKIVVSEGARFTWNGTFANWRGTLQGIGSGNTANPTEIYHAGSAVMGFQSGRTGKIDWQGTILDEVNYLTDLVVSCANFGFTMTNAAYTGNIIKKVQCIGALGNIGFFTSNTLSWYKSQGNVFEDVLAKNISGVGASSAFINAQKIYLTGKLIIKTCSVTYSVYNTYFYGTGEIHFESDVTSTTPFGGIATFDTIKIYAKGTYGHSASYNIFMGSSYIEIETVTSYLVFIYMSIYDNARMYVKNFNSSRGVLYTSPSHNSSTGINRIVYGYAGTANYGYAVQNRCDMRNLCLEWNSAITTLNILDSISFNKLNLQQSRTRTIKLIPTGGWSTTQHKALGAAPQDEPILAVYDDTNNYVNFIGMLDPLCDNRDTLYSTAGVTWTYGAYGISLAAGATLTIDTRYMGDDGQMDLPISSFAALAHDISPAPSMAALTVTYKISFDGGGTWSVAQTQAQMRTDAFTINGDDYTTDSTKDIQLQILITNPTGGALTITQWRVYGITYDPLQVEVVNEFKKLDDIQTGIDDMKGTGFIKDTHSLVNIIAGIAAIVVDFTPVYAAITAAQNAILAVLDTTNRLLKHIHTILNRAKVILFDKTNDKPNYK